MAVFQSAATETLLSDVTNWTRTKMFQGNGLIVEGQLVAAHIHHMKFGARKPDGTLPGRFIVLLLRVRRCWKRNFGPNGVEIPPRIGKSVYERKGFLTLNEKNIQGQDESKDVLEAVRIVETTCMTKFARECRVEKDATKLHPNQQGVFAFFVDGTGSVTLSDFGSVGSEYRLKTKGDCPMVESITRLDAGKEAETLSFFAGGTAVGDSWGDKIMSLKKDEESSSSSDDDSDWD